MPKPSIMARAKGLGRLNALHAAQEKAENPDWRPVPGFHMYEVNQLRQVRRVSTGVFIPPYKYPMRPYEGEFVDFWISGQKHAMSLDTIMMATFNKTEFA